MTLSAYCCQRVLVVDDDELVRITVCEVLNHRGYSAIQASSDEEATNLLMQSDTAAVVVELNMQNLNPVELVATARRLHPDIAVVAVSDDRSELEVATESLQADAAIAKPFEIAELVVALNVCLADLSARARGLTLQGRAS
jgi:DNA-binding response OmpR family regulator